MGEGFHGELCFGLYQNQMKQFFMLFALITLGHTRSEHYLIETFDDAGDGPSVGGDVNMDGSDNVGNVEGYVGGSGNMHGSGNKLNAGSIGSNLNMGGSDGVANIGDDYEDYQFYL